MSAPPKKEIDVVKLCLDFCQKTVSSTYICLMAVIPYVQARISVDTVRPLPMFLGILGGAGFCFNFGIGAYTSPAKSIDKSTIEKFKSRLKLNVAFFMSNYALIVLSVAGILAFLHPTMLISLGLLWVLWSVHSFLNRHELLLFSINFSTLIPSDKRTKGLSILTIAVILWKCLTYVFYVTSISSLLIFTHALLRDPKHIDKFSDVSFGHKYDDDDHHNRESDDNNFQHTNAVGLGGSEVMVDYPNSSPMNRKNKARASDAV